MTGILPGTIACVRLGDKPLCERTDGHRHELVAEYGQGSRMAETTVFQPLVVGLAEHYGLSVHWVHDSRRQQRGGWPDLTIYGGTRILFRELKSHTGNLSVLQRRCGSRLAHSGADWAVWRPAELYSGYIETRLIEIGWRLP